MSQNEILEVSELYSLSGMLSEKLPLIETRPFRKVHHTASAASILGGGRNSRPGEVSLAHKGVLFFDELLEFNRHTLESLREPIEDGVITISRVLSRSTYPTRFLFVGATNPCPCGYAGDLKKECICSKRLIEQYQSKLSGPLLDRIDLRIRVQRTETEEMEKISLS